MEKTTVLAITLAAILALSVVPTAAVWADSDDKEKNQEKKLQKLEEKYEKKKKRLEQKYQEIKSKIEGRLNNDDSKYSTPIGTMKLTGRGLGVVKTDNGFKPSEATLTLTGILYKHYDERARMLVEGTADVGGVKYNIRAEGKAGLNKFDLGKIILNGRVNDDSSGKPFHLNGVVVSVSNDDTKFKVAGEQPVFIGRQIRIYALQGDMQVEKNVPPPPTPSPTTTLSKFNISPIGNQVAGTDFTFIVTAINSQGNTMTNFTGTVTMSTNDGSSPNGTAPVFTPSAYTFVSADNGQHAFSAKLYNAKTGVTITATGGGKNGTSNTFNVSPAAISSVTLTPSSASLPSAGSTTFAAKAFDAYGNQVTSNFSWVATPAIGTVTPSANTTTAAFNAATLTTTASGTVNATASGTSVKAVAPVTVNAQVTTLDHFNISAIPNQTAGGQFTFIATAVNNLGNTMTNYAGTVTITTNNGNSPSGQAPSLTPSPYTFVAGDNGQHAFTARLYNAMNGVTITVTDSGKTGTSNTFNVSAASIASVSVTPATANVTAGSTAPFSAKGLDAYSNQVSGLTFVWSISNSTVGTIVPTGDTSTATFGAASLVNPGTATLTAATTVSGTTYSGTATVNVKP